MNRRNFITAIGMTAGVLVVPGVLKADSSRVFLPSVFEDSEPSSRSFALTKEGLADAFAEIHEHDLACDVVFCNPLDVSQVMAIGGGFPRNLWGVSVEGLESVRQGDAWVFSEVEDEVGEDEEGPYVLHNRLFVGMNSRLNETWSLRFCGSEPKLSDRRMLNDAIESFYQDWK